MRAPCLAAVLTHPYRCLSVLRDGVKMDAQRSECPENETDLCSLASGLEVDDPVAAHPDSRCELSLRDSKHSPAAIMGIKAQLCWIEEAHVLTRSRYPARRPSN